MAGQRSYYSNVLTTARGAVRGTVAFNVITTSSNPSIITGRGFSISGSGGTSLYTVYFPERFGTTAITLLNTTFVCGTTLLAETFITGGYSVPTVTNQAACIQLQVLNSTTLGAVSGPKGVCYVEFEAELGF